MSDNLTKEQRAHVMARNKGKGTRSTELSLRARLSAAGISGWKFQPQGILGKPDFAFPDKKLAIFIDGCFWHGCAKCRTIPKTNTEFWEQKIMGNIARDKHVSNRLRRSGWHVLRFWEHDLKENPSSVISRIQRKVQPKKTQNGAARMTRRSQPRDTSTILKELQQLLADFESELVSGDLRAKVLALVPAVHALRDLGSSLISKSEANSARNRVLLYFRRYLQQIIKGDELLVVAGINEWPRRIRELRVQFGWKILSGRTIREMIEETDISENAFGQELGGMKPDCYILLSADQDFEAAYRWHVANSIRRGKASVQDKVLSFLRENVGKPVSGEELRYVANDRTEWARRTRELRTEEGWPIATKQTGRPDLNIGEYVLEMDRQSPVHDRNIPDLVRVEVLKRDNFQCTSPNCGWSYSQRQPGDPRQLLELHHVQHHVEGGENTADNLITLCNVHHDEIHRHQKLDTISASS